MACSWSIYGYVKTIDYYDTIELFVLNLEKSIIIIYLHQLLHYFCATCCRFSLVFPQISSLFLYQSIRKKNATHNFQCMIVHYRIQQLSAYF